MKFSNAQIKHSADGTEGGIITQVEPEIIEAQEQETKTEEYVKKSDFDKLMSEIAGLKETLSQQVGTKKVETKQQAPQGNYVTKDELDKILYVSGIDKITQQSLDKANADWRNFPLNVVQTLVATARQHIKTEAPDGFSGKPATKVQDVAGAMEQIVAKIKAEKAQQRGGK